MENLELLGLSYLYVFDSIVYIVHVVCHNMYDPHTTPLFLQSTDPLLALAAGKMHVSKLPL
jgi:hypothetical protein